MNACETWFAIVKSYIALNIFMLPLGFKNGGWLISPLTVIIVCAFMLIGTLRLVSVAR